MRLDSVKEYAAKKWENAPSTATPITAENLNHMEDGIKDNSAAVKAIVESVSDDVSEDANKIASMAALYKTDRKIGSEELPGGSSDLSGAVNWLNEELEGKTSQLKEDIVYKRNARLTPVQFETVLGYYSYNEFVSGKKEWGARLMRVQCKKGDKYLYHGYCDNIYGVSFLDSDFGIIRQIHVPKNKEFEMDVNVIDNASYIDFYSASFNTKTYVLKYNREDTNNNDVGKIFTDASSQLSETDNKYFSPAREELVDAKGMILKSITPENDTVFKFSFVQHQVATAYVDDFCIVTSDDYVNGTEVKKILLYSFRKERH